MFWKLSAIWKQNFFTICFLNINPPLLPLPWGNGSCWILIFDIGYILQRKNNFIEPIKYFLKKCSEEFHLLQVSFNISHWKWNDPVITITETTSFKSQHISCIVEVIFELLQYIEFMLFLHSSCYSRSIAVRTKEKWYHLILDEYVWQCSNNENKRNYNLKISRSIKNNCIPPKEFY